MREKPVDARKIERKCQEEVEKIDKDRWEKVGINEEKAGKGAARMRTKVQASFSGLWCRI